MDHHKYSRPMLGATLTKHYMGFGPPPPLPPPFPIFDIVRNNVVQSLDNVWNDAVQSLDNTWRQCVQARTHTHTHNFFGTRAPCTVAISATIVKADTARFASHQACFSEQTNK